jgi:hypothetical protein
LRRGGIEQFGPREEVRRWIAQRNQLALKAQNIPKDARKDSPQDAGPYPDIQAEQA